MSAAVPPIPSETAVPHLSEIQRLANIFTFSPSQTFADIRRNPSWWAPFLLVALGLIAFFITVDKKVGFDVIARKANEHLPEFVQKTMEQMPAAERQKARERQIAGQRFGTLYLGWVFHLIGGLITAALLMWFFNFVLEAEVRFKNALSVVFYAWLPKLVFCLLAIAVLLKGVDPEGFDLANPVTTNLAFLLDPNSSSRFLYHLLTGIDVLAIWEVCLMGMGFSMQSVKKKGISTATGITTVAVMYGIFLLGRAALPF
jgi:hypothetical protein